MLLAYFLLHPSLDYCNLSLCLVCLRVVRLELPLLGNDKIGFWCLFPYLYRKVEYVLPLLAVLLVCQKFSLIVLPNHQALTVRVNVD